MRVGLVALTVAVLALAGCTIDPTSLATQVHPHTSGDGDAVTALFGEAPRLVEDSATYGTWTIDSVTSHGRRADQTGVTIVLDASGATGGASCGEFTSPATGGVLYPLAPSWTTACADDEVTWAVNSLTGLSPSLVEGTTLVLGDGTTEIVLTRG